MQRHDVVIIQMRRYVAVNPDVEEYSAVFYNLS